MCLRFPALRQEWTPHVLKLGGGRAKGTVSTGYKGIKDIHSGAGRRTSRGVPMKSGCLGIIGWFAMEKVGVFYLATSRCVEPVSGSWRRGGTRLPGA
jgi:hypothetical protein